ncbi:YqgE/AlgH family protein [Chitinophaga sedimenti]|nr:YqgE/AlgH family protein [Chitinophaga sedimenti]MCK7559801.1 YqgE/AlgH family protein [Chitinophaga sedimenti]
MKPGIFIKSTSALDDTVFQNTLIYITEYNDNGATGFVVNQPFSRSLNELEEFKHLPPFPIHVGGPVDQEHLFSFTGVPILFRAAHQWQVMCVTAAILT